MAKRSLRILAPGYATLLALAVVTVSAWSSRAEPISHPTEKNNLCTRFFEQVSSQLRSKFQILSSRLARDRTDVELFVSAEDLNLKDWQNIAVTLRGRIHFDRDRRIVVKHPEERQLVYVKQANSRTDTLVHVPLIETMASGKREILYHDFDQELGFELTGNTVAGKLSNGEPVTLSQFHRDHTPAAEMEFEAPRAERLPFEIFKLQREIADLPIDTSPESPHLKMLQSLLKQRTSDLQKVKRWQTLDTRGIQRMGLLDILLGHLDRHRMNWMVGPNGEIKAIDNSRILGVPGRMNAMNTYNTQTLPAATFGAVDPEAVQKLLSLTPDRLDEILKSRDIPWMYRVSAKRRLKRLQASLQSGQTFSQILNTFSDAGRYDTNIAYAAAPSAFVLGGVIYQLEYQHETNPSQNMSGEPSPAQ